MSDNAQRQPVSLFQYTNGANISVIEPSFKSLQVKASLDLRMVDPLRKPVTLKIPAKSFEAQ